MATERRSQPGEQEKTNTNPFQFEDGQPGTVPDEKKKKRPTPDQGEAANKDPAGEVAHPTMPQP